MSHQDQGKLLLDSEDLEEFEGMDNPVEETLKLVIALSLTIQ